MSSYVQAQGETKQEQQEEPLKTFLKNVPVGFNGLGRKSIPRGQRVCYMTYGRYQPCHKGHLSLFNNMCQLSNQEKERNGISSAGPPNVYVFVSHTGGPDYDKHDMQKYKDNPLDSGDKRNLIYEQVGGSDNLITIIDCATHSSLNGVTGAIAALQTCYKKVIVVLGEDRQTDPLAQHIKRMVNKKDENNLVHGGKLDGKDRPASGTNTRRMTWDNKVVGKNLTAKTEEDKNNDKINFINLVRDKVGEGYQDDTDALGQAILPYPPNISNERIEDLFYKIKFSQPLIDGYGRREIEKEKLYRGFVSKALAVGKHAEDAVLTNKKVAGIAARVEFFKKENFDKINAWEKKEKKKKKKKNGGKRTKKRKRTKRRKTRKTKRRTKRRTKRKNKRKTKRKTKRKKK
jgi:hypothetical protein